MASATDIWSGNGQGTQSSPYEIWNVDLLFAIRNFSGSAGSGKYFRLEKDIDLTEYLEGYSWEPIGTSAAPFKGIFLGNGKKITGLTINSSSNYQGFFGYISGATIQDLTIEGTVKGAGYVGGIVGSSSGTNTIRNCTFNGNVTGSGSYVGGIAGSFAGTLNKVYHTGTTKGAGYVGGIVGQHASGSINTATNTGNVTATSSSYAGGVVGLCSVAITGANNKGTVTGKEYTGGMAGAAEGGKSVDVCSAEGAVTGTNYTGGLIGNYVGGTVLASSAKGTINGSQYTGGLIGKSTGSVSISSHSGGNVSGSSYVGGLIGQSSSPLNGSRHSGGNVSGTDYVGGLAGSLSSGSVTECYSYANITGTDNVGGIIGCYTLNSGNSPQIKSSGFFGNINARQYVGGVLGQIQYTGNVQAGGVTKPKLHTYKTYGMSFSGTDDSTYQETLTETNNVFLLQTVQS